MNLHRLTRLRIPVVIRNIFGSWQVCDVATGDYWHRDQGHGELVPRYYDTRSIANRAIRQHREAMAWHRTIATLQEWARDPEQLRDDDIAPPTSIAIATAVAQAREMAAEGIRAPLRVLAAGDGGIVFEWQLPGRYKTIEVEDDGRVTAHSVRDLRGRKEGTQ